jgi:hypothetical protein
MQRVNHGFSLNFPDAEPMHRRYFLKLFQTKRRPSHRPGAIPADELKRQIIAIGRGKKINITRLDIDGTLEESPVSVKIIDIGADHFTGKVVNVERSISESQSEKLIYARAGGGTIDFRFSDGDIKKVEVDIDEQIVKQRNIDEIREILEALDVGEDINISYYDKNEGGVINGTGVLDEKDMETLDFRITLRLINEIELTHPREVHLNLEKNEILDLEVVI